MPTFDPRRRRLLLAGLGLSGLMRSPVARSAANGPHVVVIGGGFGGASCARTLRRLAPQVRITLLEPRAHFFTGPSTNAALVGLCAEGDIVHGPGALAAEGIELRLDRAISIDPVTRRVRTASGATLEADRIVLSPGVAMRWDRVQGLAETMRDQMPHAWLGDTQVATLRRRIGALRDGATVAIVAPPNPYRCPPGPYERASLIAWHLRRGGRGRGKVLVLDAKDDFSKRPLFQLGWDTLYPGTVEWVSREKGGELAEVLDAPRNRLRLRNGSRVQADLVSLVPPQRAADIAVEGDLADESGWCPVNPASFESTRHRGIHVIGDACHAHPMPKSAFSANSQGKLVALSLAARFSGRAPPAARLVNTCYSLLAPDYGISVGGLYGVVSERLSTLNDGMSPLGAAREYRAREAAYAHDWYEQITRDSFG